MRSKKAELIMYGVIFGFVVAIAIAYLAKLEIDVPDKGVDFNTAVTKYEKTLIINALEKTNWIKNKAADLLQIKRTTLVEKIKRHKIKKEA